VEQAGRVQSNVFFPQHISGLHRDSFVLKFQELWGGIIILFGFLPVCISFQELAAACSRHNPNNTRKSGPGRLRSHACVIDFSASEADEETQQGSTSPLALVGSVWQSMR